MSIKMQPNADLLEKQVLDEEKEFEIIKEALAQGNIDALANLPSLKGKKKQLSSARVPKQLSQAEIDKRNYQRELKEVERLEEIQRKLFKGKKKVSEIKRPTLLTPIQKKTSQIDIPTVLKENPIFNDKKETKKKNTTTTPIITNTTNIVRTTKNKLSTVSSSSTTAPLKVTERVELECDIDKQKDDEYLHNLPEEEKNFIMEKTPDLFLFLQSIYLSRFLWDFIKDECELIEDLIELNDEFFEKNAYLNNQQKKKVIDKIKEIKLKKEIELIELQEAEEFKKAVEEFRNKNKTSEYGMTAKNEKEIIPTKSITCCWSCLKPIFDDDAIDKIEEECIFKLKSFCSQKCLRVFEEKKSLCFICKSPLIKDNIDDGLDKEHFCSMKCQDSFMNKCSNNTSCDAYLNDKDISKQENDNDDNKEEDINNDQYYESDHYDPMDDF